MLANYKEVEGTTKAPKGIDRSYGLRRAVRAVGVGSRCSPGGAENSPFVANFYGKMGESGRN